MVYQFLLPDIGEGTHEAEVVRWMVKEGDVVTEDQILLEIQSDKAMAELPSPVAGTVLKRYFAEGEMALVKKPICDIETANSSGKEAPVVVAEQPSQSVTSQPTTAAPIAARTDVDIRSIAIPRVRKYAREKGVDLTIVPATGAHGKVTMADVEAFLAGGLGAVVATTANTAPVIAEVSAPVVDAVSDQVATKPVVVGEIRREKMTPMRRATNKALTHTVQTVPVVTVLDKVDVSALVAHRARLKPVAAKRDINLTYTPYVVKAAVAMLKKFPEMNGFVDMEAGELCYRNTYNVGVATNTDSGLFVPVVAEADRKSLFEIASDIVTNGEKAKNGQLTTVDMSQGSLTITNVGGAAIGGVWSTPIINAPESCIIGIGRFEEEFVPDEDRQPVLRPICKISFAFDHRLIDGVTAQSALNEFKMLLNDPDLLLAES
ncbi:MAG: dihydrolipoamide acetyltransferase family protein [Propionibacteriaceae bacterium]